MYVWSEAGVSGEMIEFCPKRQKDVIFGCVAENESITKRQNIVFSESVLNERWTKKDWKSKNKNEMKE